MAVKTEREYYKVGILDLEAGQVIENDLRLHDVGLHWALSLAQDRSVWQHPMETAMFTFERATC